MTVIEMTEADIEKFKVFMEHYDKISLMVEAGVFEQKKATIALNFDHTGALKSIQRADFLFTSQFDTLK